jgi:hypothetical protein
LANLGPRFILTLSVHRGGNVASGGLLVVHPLAEQKGAERQTAMEALILGWLKIRLRTKRCFSADKP